jgi:hypothetical protein
MEQMQAAFNNTAFKEALAIGSKYSTQRIFGVEGLAP